MDLSLLLPSHFMQLQSDNVLLFTLPKAIQYPAALQATQSQKDHGRSLLNFFLFDLRKSPLALALLIHNKQTQSFIAPTLIYRSCL
jgi:hypothetical protein